MIACSKCGKQLDDNARFCDGCGEKVIHGAVCPNCGKEVEEGMAFCRSCGAKLSADRAESAFSAAPVPAASTASAPTPVQTAVMPAPAPAAQPVFVMAAADAAAVKKPFPKKAILFGGIGLAAIAVIIGIIVLIMGSKSALGDNYTLYFKSDGEMYLNTFSGEPWQITERLGAPSNSDLYESVGQIGEVVTFSKDGKTIFYPDRLSNASNGLTLYYRDVKSREEGVRIDSSVVMYSVNDSAQVVTYLKRDGSSSYGNLYQYVLNKDEKNKIGSDVHRYYISDDGKKIIYVNNENSIYYADTDTDSREKIDGGINYISYCSEDLTVLYYIKDDSLYKITEGQDKVKIASDVSTVYKIYDSGEAYYSKNTENDTVYLMDYVQDDLKDSDALITEPVYPTYPEYPTYPTYPFSWRYDSQEEYEAAVEEYDEAIENYNKERDRLQKKYEEDVDKYYEDYDKYRAKRSRDNLRESLMTTPFYQKNYSLYYYNGTEEQMISDSYKSYESLSYDSAVIAFSAYKHTEFEGIKLSEVTDAYDVSEKVSKALFSEYEYFLAAKGTAKALEGVASSINTQMIIDSKGDKLYYIAIEEGEGRGDLYSASIIDGVVQASEIYDTDVIISTNFRLFDGKPVYWKKDSDAAKGDLYIGKERIDFDIDFDSVRFNDDTGIISYFTDKDSKGNGTLKICQSSSSDSNLFCMKVSDDVFDYCVLPNGKILYLTDYSTNRFKGELHMYSNGKTEKVDDDVVAVFKIDNGKRVHSILY